MESFLGFISLAICMGWVAYELYHHFLLYVASSRACHGGASRLQASGAEQTGRCEK